MARLTERIATARCAVASLRELAEKSKRTIVERDAMLQRFEYSVEAVWKAVQLHLREQEGLDVGSPKGPKPHGAHVRGGARTTDRSPRSRVCSPAVVLDRSRGVATESGLTLGMPAAALRGSRDTV
jgi:hypothetical protein